MKAQLEISIGSTRKTRSLFPPDLGTVVSIDAALAGRPRGAYFDRRLTAAQRDPERHLQFAVEENGMLAGFMLGRALEGEFGRSEPAVRLEAFGVAPAAQGRGLGALLAAAFEAEKGHRTGDFMNKVPVNEQNVGTFLDLLHDVGIPYFIKQGSGLRHFRNL